MVGYFKYLGFIILIIITGHSCKNSGTGLSSYEELNVSKSLIIVDSIILMDNQKAYWFCQDLGISGYSTGRIGVAFNKEDLIQMDRFIIISDGITDIGLVGEDTLQINILPEYSNSMHIDIKVANIPIKIKYSDDTDGMIINRIERMNPPLVRDSNHIPNL